MHTKEIIFTKCNHHTIHVGYAYWWGNNLRHTAEVWIKFSVKSYSCANCWKGLKHPAFSAGDDDGVCVVGDDTDLSTSCDKSPSNWSLPWLRDSIGSVFSFFFVFFSTLGGSLAGLVAWFCSDKLKQTIFIYLWCSTLLNLTDKHQSKKKETKKKTTTTTTSTKKP